jgi:hypothetical protein
MTLPRVGDWMQTYSGGIFWPLDPRPEEVNIEDIAHALANACRYAGHCLRFYSVAQHSVLVSMRCRPENALWGLLHDASEAYLLDVPRPVKPHLPGYKDAEARVMQAITYRYGLPPIMPEDVKEADGRMLATEQRDLMAPPPRPWNLPHEPYEHPIHPMSPENAKKFFLDRFNELTR